MKTFIGIRTPSGCKVTVTEPGRRRRPLPGRLSEVNHSPDLFEWGYGGSGPAQLAYALLREITDKETALKHYMTLKFVLVGRMPKDRWSVTREQLEYLLQVIRLSMGGQRYQVDGDRLISFTESGELAVARADKVE